LAEVQDEQITLQGVIAALDGTQALNLSVAGSDPVLLGQELAHKALEAGAQAYISHNSLSD
jgi:porphobilinogen deaminase